MDQIIETIKNWQYIGRLPADWAGFRLILKMDAIEDGYEIFSYECTERYRSFSVYYNQATKEYSAQVRIGLTEFCDISFITADITNLENMLDKRLGDTLQKLGKFSSADVCCIFADKKIREWPYGNLLPEEIAGFHLFIRPSEPVKVINGSYIIIDYSDFACESNLIIYYNIFRDEFFGEIRIKRTPKMAGEFETKTLPDLEEKLKLYLDKKLIEMREYI